MVHTRERAIGLDFGTTNSAMALATPDGATLATFWDGQQQITTFRSVLYFDPDDLGPTGKPRATAGPEAIQSYVQAGTRGRLIQSLKSFLASPLFSQTTIFGTRYTLEGLIATIVRQLKNAAETQFGQFSPHVVVGRPAHFSGADDDAADARALQRLQTAITQAGFAHVEFVLEPVAAAYQYEQQLDHDELVLIADFGGGTSDFSLIQLGPTARQRGQRSDDILGTDGVAVAGDTFDSRLVRHLVAPQLGFGSQYRSMFDKILPVPVWLYEHLERWHYLSFLKTPKTLDTLRQIHAQALEPHKIEALMHVVQEDLGYALFQAIERTKCALSDQEGSAFVFDDPPVAVRGEVHRAAFEGWIHRDIEAIAHCVDRLLARCNVATGDVDSVFLTGGSSFVPAVRRLFAERFGVARLRGGEELTAVAQGLALHALTA
jgi:hypothetical chaperone protein